jgi:hypothetical protein
MRLHIMLKFSVGTCWRKKNLNNVYQVLGTTKPANFKELKLIVFFLMIHAS